LWLSFHHIIIIIIIIIVNAATLLFFFFYNCYCEVGASGLGLIITLSTDITAANVVDVAAVVDDDDAEAEAEAAAAAAARPPAGLSHLELRNGFVIINGASSSFLLRKHIYLYIYIYM